MLSVGDSPRGLPEWSAVPYVYLVEQEVRSKVRVVFSERVEEFLDQ